MATITLFAHPCYSSPANPWRDEDVTPGGRHTNANVLVKDPDYLCHRLLLTKLSFRLH
ncbi:hypothetical protein KOSB73_70058 [Klebsiella grimontii]|uniref:Uncharacterized protein n=1 Tax=Klebsiella grimontii TaxID=2058152 RepID=A0A285BAM1_9ENTR|nr:hypothetical protein KOSB73_70058 [Klebsiella grimontii]